MVGQAPNEQSWGLRTAVVFERRFATWALDLSRGQAGTPPSSDRRFRRLDGGSWQKELGRGGAQSARCLEKLVSSQWGQELRVSDPLLERCQHYLQLFPGEKLDTARYSVSLAKCLQEFSSGYG